MDNLGRPESDGMLQQFRNRLFSVGVVVQEMLRDPGFGTLANKAPGDFPNVNRDPDDFRDTEEDRRHVLIRKKLLLWPSEAEIGRREQSQESKTRVARAVGVISRKILIRL